MRECVWEFGGMRRREKGERENIEEASISFKTWSQFYQNKFEGNFIIFLRATPFYKSKHFLQFSVNGLAYLLEWINLL